MKSLKTKEIGTYDLGPPKNYAHPGEEQWLIETLGPRGHADAVAVLDGAEIEERPEKAQKTSNATFQDWQYRAPALQCDCGDEGGGEEAARPHRHRASAQQTPAAGPPSSARGSSQVSV